MDRDWYTRVGLYTAITVAAAVILVPSFAGWLGKEDRLPAFVLNLCVPAADTLQAIGRVEPHHIGQGMPFEHPGVDLPLIAVSCSIPLVRLGDHRPADIVDALLSLKSNLLRRLKPVPDPTS